MSASLVLVILLLMCVATYCTRVGGLLFIGRLTKTARVPNGLDATTGAVLVAIIAPAAVDGNTGLRMALVAASLVMFTTRKAVLAVFVGAVVAALCRSLGL